MSCEYVSSSLLACRRNPLRLASRRSVRQSLVVRPREETGLARFMGWVAVTHVRRHHEHYHTRGGGHLYQGRFKSFPVQDDGHFLTLWGTDSWVAATAKRLSLEFTLRNPGRPKGKAG
jgi:hypothetical protein